jgi:hypothetical protein
MPDVLGETQPKVTVLDPRGRPHVMRRSGETKDRPKYAVYQRAEDWGQPGVRLFYVYEGGYFWEADAWDAYWDECRRTPGQDVGLNEDA